MHFFIESHYNAATRRTGTAVFRDDDGYNSLAVVYQLTADLFRYRNRSTGRTHTFSTKKAAVSHIISFYTQKAGYLLQFLSQTI